jgi:hypothetical protein
MRADFALGRWPTTAEAYDAFLAREMSAGRYGAEIRRFYTHAIREYL